MTTSVNFTRAFARLFFALASIVPMAGMPLAPPEARAQGDPLGYHEGSDFLPQTPGVTAGAPGGYYNPAAWSAGGRGETALWWNDRSLRRDQLDNWGCSFASPLGYAMDMRTLPYPGRDGGIRVRTYQLGLSAGDRGAHVGAAWRWHAGDDDLLGLRNGLVLGVMGRPNRRVSFGMSGFLEDGERATEGIFDLGVRPLGTPLLTLFGDYSLLDGERWDDGRWGAGFEVRPRRGIHLGLSAREADDDDLRFRLNLGLTFDATGVHALPRLDEDGERVSTTWLVRTTPPYKGIPAGREIRRRFDRRTMVPLDLENKTLTYQPDRWFDDERVGLLDLMRRLEAVREEPGAVGVAVNLAGFGGRPSLVWELRRGLEELRASGKRVVVYADRLDMNGYYLASVADEILLDPQGELMLPGLALHRTYLRGLLDKLGLGVEEWRFFTYKTAFQTLSRTDMSEADREQRGRMVDVIYETWRDGVCAGRGLSPEAFDAAVNDGVMILPADAKERGLIDGIGRWHDLVERLGKDEKLRVGGIPADPARAPLPDERWGRPPVVAVVYAIGECAMDTGIRGRATGKHLRELAERRDLAAAVLRADSPGGDPLPSDLVAEGTRKIRAKGKPVVVSQGDVAASGGYWISMDGTKILTTPLTVTGSIGVIAGWVWDEGFSEKSGLTADGVQRGDHADLFTGIRIPVLDQVLPERTVTDAERAMVKERILASYDDFVSGVASGRSLDEARVREIGEGRVWMGGDAMERGLTDGWGGLVDAIREAKALAGLDPDEEVVVVEYPPRRLFSLPALFPPIPGLAAAAGRLFDRSDPGADASDLPMELQYVRRIAASPMRPLLLVSPDDLPEGWGVDPDRE